MLISVTNSIYKTTQDWDAVYTVYVIICDIDAINDPHKLRLTFRPLGSETIVSDSDRPEPGTAREHSGFDPYFTYMLLVTDQPV